MVFQLGDLVLPSVQEFGVVGGDLGHGYDER